MKQKQSFLGHLASNPVGRFVLMLVTISFLVSVPHIPFSRPQDLPNGLLLGGLNNPLSCRGFRPDWELNRRLPGPP